MSDPMTIKAKIKGVGPYDGGTFQFKITIPKVCRSKIDERIFSRTIVTLEQFRISAIVSLPMYLYSFSVIRMIHQK